MEEPRKSKKIKKPAGMPNAEEDMDFDTLIQKALTSGNREDEFSLWRRLFDLENWYAVARGEENDWRPLIWEEGGKRLMPVFTHPKRNQAFIEKLGIGDQVNANMTLGMPVRGLVDKSDSYHENGINGLLINDSWSIDLLGLKDLYFYLMKPYDFKTLEEEAKVEGNTEGLLKLWKAVFDLPNWFMLGDSTGGQGRTFLSKSGNDVIAHAFLTMDAAEGTLEKVRQNPDMVSFDVIIQSPSAVIDLLHGLQPHGVRGVMFHDTDTTFGVSIQKLDRIRLHVM